MNTPEFLEYFKSPKYVEMRLGSWESNGGYVSNTCRGVPWGFRYKIAERVAKINFGCDFKYGQCLNERRNWLAMRVWKESPEYQYNGVSYCCHTCALTVGNLVVLPDDKLVLREVTALFDERLGFWRTGGCILPARLRSKQCLIHRCNYLRKFRPLPESDMYKIYELVNLKAAYKRAQEEPK